MTGEQRQVYFEHRVIGRTVKVVAIDSLTAYRGLDRWAGECRQGRFGTPGAAQADRPDQPGTGRLIARYCGLRLQIIPDARLGGFWPLC